MDRTPTNEVDSREAGIGTALPSLDVDARALREGWYGTIWGGETNAGAGGRTKSPREREGRREGQLELNSPSSFDALNPRGCFQHCFTHAGCRVTDLRSRVSGLSERVSFVRRGAVVRRNRTIRLVGSSSPPSFVFIHLLKFETGYNSKRG